ncbi:MAG: ADP-ribosylglycohydrolase family protein [Microbacteriaceae bacterium]
MKNNKPSNTHKLSTIQTDRAAGAILGMAAGDALGAGYEFKPAFEDSIPVRMKGGGGYNWAPGEWTDDTSMAIPMLQAIASGKDLLDAKTQDEIVAAWKDWVRTAPDVGIQLSAELPRVDLAHPDGAAASARLVAAAHHERNGRSAGNGSLMRTAPVALAYLLEPVKLTRAAREMSDLTHFEEDAGDACVLWSLAIRHAILNGELDIRIGLGTLTKERQAVWIDRIKEAEQHTPRDFPKNGWVVGAFQGAWSAISLVEKNTVLGDAYANQLQLTLEAAVRGGNDTDTVAAIAGMLSGARWGASAVPAQWRRIIHGWPNLRAVDLVRMAKLAVLDRNDPEQAKTAKNLESTFDYRRSHGDVSALVQHPHDSQVWLGAVGALEALPDSVDTVVSLCQIGAKQVPDHVAERIEVILVDAADPSKNAHLDFVLRDTVAAVAALRASGRTVLLHCVQAQSRTPSVAALYSALELNIPIDQAIAEVNAALPDAQPKQFLGDAIRRIATSATRP